MARMSERARFLRFLLTGGLAAAANIGSGALLNLVMSNEAAVALSYLIGMAVAFALARLVVFDRSGQPMHQEFARFALVNALGFVQVWIVSVALARLVFPWFGMVWNTDLVAHVIGVISPVAISYLLHKRYSFAGRPA